MGKKASGIYQRKHGRWAVDKYVDGVRLHQSFDSFEDAEAWLTRELEALRQRRVHGAQPQVTFDQAAGRFIEENRHLASIESYAYHLKAVMPLIGDRSRTSRAGGRPNWWSATAFPKASSSERVGGIRHTCLSWHGDTANSGRCR